MAYRLKGFLTKGHRDDIATFLGTYQAIVSNRDIEESVKVLAVATFGAWAIFLRWVLYLDNLKMIEKVICKEA